jgi:predicted dehydrogenase
MAESSGALRIGVVGTGAMGGHHVRLLSELSEAELIGGYDLDPEVGAAVAGRYGCRLYDSATHLASEIDAVVVAVPTAVHAEIGCAFLEAGVHVLLEKPIASDLKEADALLSAAGDRVLAVGHVEFHNPAVQRLLVLNPPAGFVEVHRMGVFSPRSLDIDVVLDLMIHDLQILHSLDPTPIVKLDAVGVNALTDRVDIANVRLELASGCVANLTASRISADRTRKLRIFARHAYYSLDYQEQEIRSYRLRAGGSQREIVRADLEVKKVEPLALELGSFIAACRGEGVPLVSGRDGRRALETALRVVGCIASRGGGETATPFTNGGPSAE